jgi:hypothetical protein
LYYPKHSGHFGQQGVCIIVKNINTSRAVGLFDKEGTSRQGKGNAREDQTENAEGDR